MLYSKHPIFRTYEVHSTYRIVVVNSTECIQFQYFRTSTIHQLLAYINSKNPDDVAYLSDYDEIALTGGGSFKYRHLFEVPNPLSRQPTNKSSQWESSKVYWQASRASESRTSRAN